MLFFLIFILFQNLIGMEKNRLYKINNVLEIKKNFNLPDIRYKFSYKHLSFFPHIYSGLLCSVSFLFLKKKYSLSENYKNIFSCCSLGSLFLPFFISSRQVKKIHYSFTYENMLNNFEKLRAEVFTKNIFSLV